MPLLRGKRNIGKNIKTEMAEGKSKPQSLAIALNVSRKKPKKMAEGGEVSIRDEKRPMPEDTHDDSKMVSRGDHKKPLIDSDMTSRPDIKQTTKQKGATWTLGKPPLSTATGFKVRLEDEENDLSKHIDMRERGTLSPPEKFLEEGTKRKGPDVPALHMKRMASGGEVEMEEDYTDKPDKGHGAIIFKAEGGEVEEEEAEEQHASLAAAVMAKRRKAMAGADSDSDIEQMLAEGGMADIEHENNVEQPNGYYEQNEDAALKENYDSDMLGLSQPEDSNEMGDDIPADEHDHIDMLRRRMKAKRG